MIDIKFLRENPEAVKENSKEIVRAAQDYEKSQKAKQKAGDMAEIAVINSGNDVPSAITVVEITLSLTPKILAISPIPRYNKLILSIHYI